MKQVGGALDHFLKCQDEDKQQQIASILTNQLKTIENQIHRNHHQVNTEKALDDFSYIKSCKAKFVQQPIIEEINENIANMWKEDYEKSNSVQEVEKSTTKNLSNNEEDTFLPELLTQSTYSWRFEGHDQVPIKVDNFFDGEEDDSEELSGYIPSMITPNKTIFSDNSSNIEEPEENLIFEHNHNLEETLMVTDLEDEENDDNRNNEHEQIKSNAHMISKDIDSSFNNNEDNIIETIDEELDPLTSDDSPNPPVNSSFDILSMLRSMAQQPNSRYKNLLTHYLASLQPHSTYEKEEEMNESTEIEFFENNSDDEQVEEDVCEENQHDSSVIPSIELPLVSLNPIEIVEKPIIEEKVEEADDKIDDEDDSNFDNITVSLE